MSSGSLSISESISVSDECCFPVDCACDDYLTLFCDYETVTLDYCDVTTEFTKARSSGIKMTSVRPDAGVHASDRVFKLSVNEHDVQMGIGAIITGSDGTEWIVYAADWIRSFCIWKLWARSVSACFGLLDTIDVLQQDCECEDCGNKVKYKRVARVKGKILADSASVRSGNDANDLVFRFSGDLVRWPLKTRPTSAYRLKDSHGVYRITGVTDRGVYVPYHVTLEVEPDDCTVR